MNKPAFNNPDDNLLFAHLNDCRVASEKKNAPVFSDFMDPLRAEKFKNIFNASEVFAWGGYEQAERKMLGFFPEKTAAEKIFEIFPIDVLQIKFNRRFNSPPSHRDYLGSVMGLGLERGKIGDIRLRSEGALIYVLRDVSGYIVAALERVGNTPVKISAAGINETNSADIESTGTETRITVASLRLDAVIAAAFHLSRSKAAALIEGEKVFVNWTEAASGSKNLKEGDVITVRGMGRVTLEGEAGRTKKDRHVLTVTKKGR